MQRTKYIAPVRKWSIGRGYYVLILSIPAWVRKELNLKPGDKVEVIIGKLSLEEEEPLNEKSENNR